MSAYRQGAQLAAMLLGLLTILPAAEAAEPADEFRILYFEHVSPVLDAVVDPANRKAQDAETLPLSFDAYGRRFELSLSRNANIDQNAAARGIAYRGEALHQPGSWVRLTRIGSELHGMIFAGGELYAVEPAATAREFMVSPPEAGFAGNVIYRLSDTLVNLGQDFCSAHPVPEDGAHDGLTAFNTMTADLKSRLILQQAVGATLSMRLSALGDALFLQRYSNQEEARDAILVRLNNVDGIYSAQLGVELAISAVSVYDEAGDPFTTTTVPGNLLDELGNLRNNSSALLADGITHLFTGRNLDGTTVGIAYIGSLCRARFGVGLTESRTRGATIESLIAAHEIGHNFGARHDGDPNGECGATPDDQFIMAPQSAGGNDTFSECSVTTMKRSIAEAACITAQPPADASVSSGTGGGGGGGSMPLVSLVVGLLALLRRRRTLTA